MITKFSYKDYFVHPETSVDIHWWNTSLDYRYPNLHHTHDYFEIFIVTEGELLHRIGNRSERLGKYSMQLVRPSDAHSFYPSNGVPSCHLNVAITYELFCLLARAVDIGLIEKIESAETPPCVNLPAKDFDQLILLANQVFLSERSTRNLVAHVKVLVFHMLSIFSTYKLDDNVYPDWLNELLGKINSPEFMDKRVNDVYDAAPYSPPVLIETFKQYLGCNIVQYLAKVKINYACNLLCNTNFTILHISGLIGYDSLSHFHRIFKQIVGISPAQYRRNKELPKSVTPPPI